MGFLSSDVYGQIEASMPIACVDFVLVRESSRGSREYGLILRESPYGQVWCHLGGRVLRGETIAAALQRHAAETVGVRLVLPVDPQPKYTYQWFPAVDAPTDGTPFGSDERKHSIGMAFLAHFEGQPRARNEAITFAWYRGDALPGPLWPGCEYLFGELGMTDSQYTD